VTTESLLEALRSPLAQELEPQHFDKLKELAAEVDFREDEIIFREQEECDEFYLILSGRVALEMVLRGRVVCVQMLSAGDELGWSSVLMRYGRHFQARCTCPVLALAVHGPDLLEACKQDTAFGFAIMRRLLEVVAGRLQATRLQLLEIFNIKANLA
jgi:CRP-like cAMP-binding protein